MNNHILVIDDEEVFLRSVKRVLRNCGYQNITLETNPEKAVDLIANDDIVDVAIIDVTMPVMDGITVLDNIKSISPETECIMLTAVNEASVAVKCLKKGAFDYILKPVTQEDLELCLRNAMERKRFMEIHHLNKSPHVPKLNDPSAFKPIVTRSSQMIKILKEAEIHAKSNVPILITGESGTGKELLATAIHQVSPRKKSTFTPINMAALTPSLFDAEFFGYTKGAFTGAEKDRSGYLAHTNNGTLFLDEIGILPMELQGKLLRVLQSGEYIQIGSNKPQKTDIRLIASTNEDLENLIQKNKFRKDLFYRLNGAWLHLPPLKERKEDIPILTQAFIREFLNKTKNCRLDDAVIAQLAHYDFPGNIRELRAIIQAAVNLAHGGTITVSHLPEKFRKIKSSSSQKRPSQFDELLTLAEAEKHFILKTYEYTSGNKSQTAKILDVAINTVRKKLASYGVK